MGLLKFSFSSLHRVRWLCAWREAPLPAELGPWRCGFCTAQPPPAVARTHISCLPGGSCPPALPASPCIRPRMRLQLGAAEPAAAGASLPFPIFTGWMLKRVFPRNCAGGRKLWRGAGTRSVTPHLRQQPVGNPAVGHGRCWEKTKEGDMAVGSHSGGGRFHACHTVNS